MGALCFFAAGASAAEAAYGLYKSVDSGASWIRVGQGLPVHSRINALRAVGKVLAAGTDHGIFLSPDDGQSWRPASDERGKSSRVLCFTVQGQKLFAGTHHDGVTVSEDGGRSWKPSNDGLTDRYVRSLLAEGARLYAGTDSQGVFVSDNAGQSWSRLSDGLPVPSQVFDLAAIDGNVFAGLYARGLYRLDLERGGWIQSGNVRPLALAATGKSLIAGHNPGGTFFSQDGGKSWEDGNAGLPDNAPIWTLGADATVALAGTTGKIGPFDETAGLFVSRDHGRTWERSDHGLPRAAAAISLLLTKDFFLAGVTLPKKGDGWLPEKFSTVDGSFF
jgi:photosystem II stability/assembly factor-like uncharacterized protein